MLLIVHLDSWQGLPVPFCCKYLPKKRNEWIALVDEEGVESSSYYLPLKTGLSAQWKKFAEDHGLSMVIALCLSWSTALSSG